MKKLIHYHSILIFILKSIPFLVIFWVGFWAASNTGFVDASLLEAKMHLSGSNAYAEENLPILARRKLGELAEQHQLPDINFIVSSTENPTSSSDDKYAIYHDRALYKPACFIRMMADKRIYPFNENYGIAKYAHKKELDYYFILFHEASHCVLGLMG